MNRFLHRLRQAGYLLPATLTGYLWLKGHLHQLPGLSCPFQALTGIPCPGCFLTRATSAALSGDITASLSLHAFGPLVAGGLLLWSAVALHQRRLVPLRLRRTPMLVISSALIAYWIMRLVLSYGFGVVGGLGFPAPR